MNFVSALAYYSCLDLPAAFTQPLCELGSPTTLYNKICPSFFSQLSALVGLAHSSPTHIYAYCSCVYVGHPHPTIHLFILAALISLGERCRRRNRWLFSVDLMHAAKSSLRSATALPERQPLSGFFDADPSLGFVVLVAWCMTMHEAILSY